MRQAKGPAYVAYLEAKVENLEFQLRNVSEAIASNSLSVNGDGQSSSSYDHTMTDRPNTLSSASGAPPRLNSAISTQGEHVHTAQIKLEHPELSAMSNAHAGLDVPLKGSFMPFPAADATILPSDGKISQSSQQSSIAPLNMETSRIFERRANSTFGNFLDMDPEIDDT